MTPKSPAICLPTPPSTGHREKENCIPPGTRVVWSAHNQYHPLIANSTPRVPSVTSASKDLPTKSILKKRTHALAFQVPADQREVTPEPTDPLVNLEYLNSPVATIVTPGASLRELIEAYSVLAARLRACVTTATDIDASWPLFQPLRKDRGAIVQAFTRDLGRALVDPATTQPEEEMSVREEPAALPSPKSSPRKKGMSAEKVKYARDLCTTCHSVLKLLGVIFTLPAISGVFSDEQLRTILTEVLAIPLAAHLPTPNARKTYALSIWLLQAQRLPVEVLSSAKDRIAYALRRGIEGELGKEGKKGSASDGLKAIHDLCVYQPSIFVPAFTELLPSVLANLLASTLTIRTQACHALGGFVLGSTSLPRSPIHTKISAEVAAFLTASPPPPISKSPTKSTDALILRTLRTTLSATDPQHIAQSPVWALAVIASLTVLLGPALCTDAKLNRVLAALLSLSMRHKKSSIRALTCLVWRPVAWVYFQPPLLSEDGESEVEGDEDDDAQKLRKSAREGYWKIVQSCVDMGAGVGTVAALMGHDADQDDNLRRALMILKTMVKRRGHVCDAVELVKQIIGVEPENMAAQDWDVKKLLPHGLFSAIPGLLSSDFKTLAPAARPIFDDCPTSEDVRPLTREDLARDWVLDGFIEIWRESLAILDIRDETSMHDVVAIWDGLVKANVAVLQDEGDDLGTSAFVVKITKILIDILRDTQLDLSDEPASSSDLLLTSPVKDASSDDVFLGENLQSSLSLKLTLIRRLWLNVRTSVPHALLNAAGERLIAYLMEDEEAFTNTADVLPQWALLCVETLVVCEVDALHVFWGVATGPHSHRWEWKWSESMRNSIWSCFAEKWAADEEGSWEGAVALLAAPFTDANSWDLSSDDFKAWDALLGHALNKAFDYGLDSVSVLDDIAANVSQNYSPTSTSSARIADLIMSHLDMPDARQLPDAVIEFVNETMQSTYPPEPRNKVTSLWMLRSLANIIEVCPAELTLNLLESLQDGLCTWISDDYRALAHDEYAYDVIPLYQSVLVAAQSLPPTKAVLTRIAPILESAFRGRDDKPAGTREAFAEFWNATCASLDEPFGGWPGKLSECVHIASGNTCASLLDSDQDDVASAYRSRVAVRGSLSPGHENPVDVQEFDLVFSDSEEEEEEIFQHPLPSLFDFGARAANRLSKSPREQPIFGPIDPALLMPPLSDPEVHEQGLRVPPAGKARDPPSTPTRSSTFYPHTVTPPRPLKSLPSMRSLRLLSPGSPLPASQRAPTTPTPVRVLASRSPHTPAATSPGSPSKRRKLADKENESPLRGITSVAERIAMASPKAAPAAGAGKRRLSDAGGEEHASKKARKGAESAAARVASPLAEPVAFPSRPIADAASGSSKVLSGPTSRKRKGVFMDAVVVPTVNVVRRTRFSASCDTGISKFKTPSSQVLRRTQSMIFTPRAFAINASLPVAHSEVEEDEAPSSSISSPLRALREMDMLLGSDDSIILSKAPRLMPAEPSSSDDDPHVGQVTPHHLISPAVRRTRDAFDPPSDDSVLASSPTRDHVLRRIRRAGSSPMLPALHQRPALLSYSPSVPAVHSP